MQEIFLQPSYHRIASAAINVNKYESMRTRVYITFHWQSINSISHTLPFKLSQFPVSCLMPSVLFHYVVSCHTSLHLILVTSAVSCCPFRFHHCIHAISLLNLPGVPWFTLLPQLLKSTPCCRLGVQFANGRSVDPSSSCLIFTAITDSFLANTQLLYTVSDSNSIRIEVYCLTLS